MHVMTGLALSITKILLSHPFLVDGANIFDKGKTNYKIYNEIDSCA